MVGRRAHPAVTRRAAWPQLSSAAGLAYSTRGPKIAGGVRRTPAGWLILRVPAGRGSLRAGVDDHKLLRPKRLRRGRGARPRRRDRAARVSRARGSCSAVARDGSDDGSAARALDRCDETGAATTNPRPPPFGWASESGAGCSLRELNASTVSSPAFEPSFWLVHGSGAADL